MKIGFHLYTGSNMEQLAAQYCQCRRQAPEEFFSPDLFTEEKIIVPSRCIRQWLERTLADQGVFLANVNFMSMAALQSEILCRDMDEAQTDTFRKFDRKALAWRIMELLTDTDEFEELKNYIEGGSPEESPDLRRFSLSDKIASLFHSYLESVPEYLAGDVDISGNFWKADHWQAKLWQKLCMDKSGNRLRSPADVFMDFLKSDIGDHNILPITVFGAGSMAPASLALLKKLAAVTSVNFFCFNPADSQWTQQDRENYENGKLQTEPEEIEDFFSVGIADDISPSAFQYFRATSGS